METNNIKSEDRYSPNSDFGSSDYRPNWVMVEESKANHTFYHGKSFYLWTIVGLVILTVTIALFKAFTTSYNSVNSSDNASVPSYTHGGTYSDNNEYEESVNFSGGNKIETVLPVKLPSLTNILPDFKLPEVILDTSVIKNRIPEVVDVRLKANELFHLDSIKARHKIYERTPLVKEESSNIDDINIDIPDLESVVNSNVNTPNGNRFLHNRYTGENVNLKQNNDLSSERRASDKDSLK